MKAIIVGAGINGLTTAIELKRRCHDVVLIDPGPSPHPLAASTDISKAVRAAYGTDEDYTELAERSIIRWRKWNEQFDADLYHETGVMFIRSDKMKPGDYEYESCKVFEQRGHQFERIDSTQLRQRYPAWNAQEYQDGFLEPEAGYAESGRVVATLLAHAQSSGVEFVANCRFVSLNENLGRIRGIVLNDGRRIDGDCVVMAVGAWTPYLLPFTKNFFRATGHPVFHLKPDQPALFAPERFPVFGADVSTTGYYGFPLNRDGVVKVANHGPGREMSPESPDRVVTAEEEKSLREFLEKTFPPLAKASIVYSRICLYCDTYDGHFWIAPDPERPGLILATGDSGHGFKFAPVLGEITADAVEEKSNRFLQKFRWRPEIQPGRQKEAARFLQE